MDSIKSFKGYGKVNEIEDQAFRRNTRKRMLIIAVSIVVLLTVIIAAVVGVVVHKSNNDDDNATSSSSTPMTLSDSIKAVCGVTQYPNSCFSSLSSLEKQGTSSNKAADPEELFKLCMEAAVKELSKLSTLPENLIARVNDVREKAALVDCQGLYEEAINQVNTSIFTMQSDGTGNLLTASKIDDMKTWLSAALTDLQTCLDGLEETNSASLDEVRKSMQNSTELTSNSLAIASKILTLLQTFDLNIHRRRKLLGFGFPEWIGPADRKLLQQVNYEPNVTVAKDGTGKFKTITEAVEAVPKQSKSRFVIYVKGGVYEENVVVDKSKWNVMMYGDGKTKTIISGNRSFVGGTPTFATATLVAVGRGFMAMDIGVRNTAGPENHQAVALRSGSDLSVFYRCSFDAYQDTLYAHSNRQFYRDCDISGTIDFIFGNAAVVFQRCNIQPRQPMTNQYNTITAQGKTDPNQNTGISIQRCLISPFDNVTALTYLGRPWKNYSTTVIMQSGIASIVDPTGWIPWIPNTTPPSTIFYAEYYNTGPGSNLDKRVKWEGYKPNITDEQASKFTVASFIRGSDWLPQTTVSYDSSLE
ncbi:hypothetical protein NE237_029034 [Protea cynaroides]|uniref:Pectinesterase n=1 Tax=Protea cynaroides TaxID=273540 RepID=A0A9Q0JUP8_9MAGN|nr:hypothetical protein NE237_029034 [Protea cynaroides]